MRKFLKRLMFVSLIGVATLVAAGVVMYFVFRPTKDIRDLMVIRAEWQFIHKETPEENSDRARRCLEVAHKHPGTVGGLSALLLAAIRSPKSDAGKEANHLLGPLIETADIGDLAKAFIFGGMGPWRNLENHAPAFLARASQSPEHPKTPRLLTAVCATTRPDEDGTPPAIFAEAANLIADNYAASPEVVDFCHTLLSGDPWTTSYERHLRAILQANQDRYVRCSAHYALAVVVQATSEDRQPEAEKLFEHYLAEFDGKVDYRGQIIEQSFRTEAAMRLAEIRACGLGKLAPAITGVDLHDSPMTLDEYRGKVMLINFWATWCFPCMKAIPHEIELAKAFQNEPFQIVGVNSDSDIGKARDAVVRTKMTWRSFRDIRDGHATISKDWKVLGYPTVFLIDHHGIIRRRWVGYPPSEDLLHVTRTLVDAARRKVPVEEMQPIVAALRKPVKESPAAPKQPAVTPPKSSGFTEKVLRNPDDSESKYVVFVPPTYDGTTAFPAILYLHGAGSRGSDGKRHLQYGLAKTIRDKGEDFPFIAIFPQARENENFTRESKGGQRALAILEQVQKDYRIDGERIILTGVSMGGEGTWSLASAEPNRWAAIVPLCHGGDTNSAARLKDIPCWCFHGDADKTIPPQQSRDMVQAIQQAGGRPLYHELPGVGHNDCPDRAYGLTDLWEWMRMQKRANR